MNEFYRGWKRRADADVASHQREYTIDGGWPRLTLNVLGGLDGLCIWARVHGSPGAIRGREVDIPFELVDEMLEMVGEYKARMGQIEFEQAATDEAAAPHFVLRSVDGLYAVARHAVCVEDEATVEWSLDTNRASRFDTAHEAACWIYLAGRGASVAKVSS